MAFRVEFTQVAADDLQQISEFIEQDDPEAATNVCRHLFDLAMSLAQNPGLGRMTPEYRDPAIRDIVKGNYRIVYVVDESSGLVQIARF